MYVFYDTVPVVIVIVMSCVEKLNMADLTCPATIDGYGWANNVVLFYSDPLLLNRPSFLLDAELKQVVKSPNGLYYQYIHECASYPNISNCDVSEARPTSSSGVAPNSSIIDDTFRCAPELFLYLYQNSNYASHRTFGWIGSPSSSTVMQYKCHAYP